MIHHTSFKISWTRLRTYVNCSQFLGRTNVTFFEYYKLHVLILCRCIYNFSLFSSFSSYLCTNCIYKLFQIVMVQIYFEKKVSIITNLSYYKGLNYRRQYTESSFVLVFPYKIHTNLLFNNFYSLRWIKETDSKYLIPRRNYSIFDVVYVFVGHPVYWEIYPVEYTGDPQKSITHAKKYNHFFKN